MVSEDSTSRVMAFLVMVEGSGLSDEMKGRLILEVLTGKDEGLLVRRNAFLVLDLGLDIVDGVGGFNIEDDGVSTEGFDGNLHTT
jgi:hypothetical protein